MQTELAGITATTVNGSLTTSLAPAPAECHESTIEKKWSLRMTDSRGEEGFNSLARKSRAMASFFGVWLWAIGILRIAEAIRLRKEIPGDVWLALSGVARYLSA